MKKLIALLFILLIGGLLIYSYSKKDTKLSFKISDKFIEKAPLGIGMIFGESSKVIEGSIGAYYPQKLIENTVSNVTKKVSSDAASAVTSVTDNFVGDQFVNSYKNLPAPVQNQVKEQVCKP